MKRLAAAITAFMLAASLGTASPTISTAAVPAVGGHVAAAYLAAGGSTAMGDPFGAEHRVRISRVNGYSQRFASQSAAGGVSTVVWNRKDKLHGWATTASAPDPRLAKVSNERDALAAVGLTQGLVYRSGDLVRANTSDKLNLAGLLRGGVIIDLRASGTRDPNLPGVKEVRYPMTSTVTLTTFVTRSRDRKSLGKAFQALAKAVAKGKPVLIHCHLGRDRTGWASAVLEALLGAPDSAIRADYLRSSGTLKYRLTDAFAKVASRYPDATLHGATYPGVYRYATAGLGLTGDQIAALRAALG